MSIFVLASLLTLPAAVAAASPATGLWRTAEDNGQVQIYDCGASLCGRLVTSNELLAHPDLKDVNNRNAAQRGRPVKGMDVMSGFSGGPKNWSGGMLYRPQDGRSYSGRLELIDGGTLEVTGCLMATLCHTQTWTRLK
jgi:uncharacterized protein (DUF2147 family)